MTLREVVWSVEAQHVIDAECIKYPRLRDVYEALEVRLSYEPEIGAKVPGTNPQAYVIRSREWLGIPGLALVYTFDDHQTVMIAARALNDDSVAGADDDE